jgi:hypothetical protein
MVIYYKKRQMHGKRECTVSEKKDVRATQDTTTRQGKKKCKTLTENPNTKRLGQSLINEQERQSINEQERQRGHDEYLD